MSWQVTPTFTWNETVWNPSMISTALWLDAADASTVTTESSAVSQWNDKSGNGRNAVQSTTANRPSLISDALNGANTVGFNGSNRFIDVPDFYISNWFMLVVGKTNSTNTQQEILAKFLSESNREYLFRFTNQNKLLALINPVGNSGPSNTTVTTAASVGTSFGIFGFYKSGTACQLGVNGTIETGTFNTSTVFDGTSPLRIGANPNGLDFLNGEIQKVVITSTAPSDTIMRKLEGWAAWSTGLTSLLPSDHPYKTVGPTP